MRASALAFVPITALKLRFRLRSLPPASTVNNIQFAQTNPEAKERGKGAERAAARRVVTIVAACFSSSPYLISATDSHRLIQPNRRGGGGVGFMKMRRSSVQSRRDRLLSGNSRNEHLPRARGFVTVRKGKRAKESPGRGVLLCSRQCPKTRSARVFLSQRVFTQQHSCREVDKQKTVEWRKGARDVIG